jgi:hypothetical protein
MKFLAMKLHAAALYLDPALRPSQLNGGVPSMWYAAKMLEEFGGRTNRNTAGRIRAAIRRIEQSTRDDAVHATEDSQQ